MHMAFGYALSFVRDFQEAEDVVQEAFVAAWYALPTLAEPAAFAAWPSPIVHRRSTRRRSIICDVCGSALVPQRDA
jgi:DNA-directed RNA polymerase specialized sigma24 family protein